MKIATLDDLYLMELKDLYSAEKQIIKALPKMVKAASSTALKESLSDHLEVTKNQLARLEEIGAALGKSLAGHKCAAMEGLVKEGAELVGEVEDEAVRDAAIISASQRIEHYEMAGYGTARTFARLLGHEDAANSLQETLDEESSADEKLTELAESEINIEANQAQVEE